MDQDSCILRLLRPAIKRENQKSGETVFTDCGTLNREEEILRRTYINRRPVQEKGS